MSLSTHSKWFFGHEIDAANYSLPFDEGAGEILAELNAGSYSLSEFATEIARAMNAVGGQVYTATVNRATRKITISAPGTFALLITTGSTAGTACFALAGFSGADVSGASSYTGGSASGLEYATQFVCQDFVESSDLQGAADATVHKSATGRVEVVKFGTESFFELSLKYATSRPMGSGSPIRENLTGLADLRTFMQNLVTKNRLEFMPDENDPNTFHKVILEKTPENDKGVAYKLREMYGRGLPGFFETGVLKFRVVQ
jgi:hypothetical protein